MKLHFLCLIFLLLPTKFDFKNVGNVILLNFTTSTLQVDIDPQNDIEIYSTKKSKWIIPKRFKRNYEVILTERKLSIKMRNSTFNEINGNITACQLNSTEKSVLEYYEIPKCCPCCSWDKEHLCNSFYEKIEKCSTIILYSPIKLANTLALNVYDNSKFLLPCPMEISHFQDDLKIVDYLTNMIYLHYKNGVLEDQEKHVSYDPTAGLCFNTSRLDHMNTYINCEYSKKSFTFFVIKLDFRNEIIISSLIYKNKDNIILIINNTDIKILENTTFRIQCRAQYSVRRNHQLSICMNLEISPKNPTQYNCSEFLDYLWMELEINSQTIKNGSKLSCSTIHPSKKISEKLETTIYKYPKKVLRIKDYNSLNNKVFKISKNDSMIEIPIFFYAIPSNGIFNCTYEQKNSLKLKIHCNISIAEQCTCYIETEKLIQRKSSVNLTFTISNDMFKESLNVMLFPIFLEKPEISGLSATFEKHKRVFCNVEVSNPFNITWDIEYNKYKKYVHHSISKYITLPLYNDTNYLCVSCNVTNDAGSNSSKMKCKYILDVDIHEDKVVQIFLINSTIWKNKTVKKEKEITFLESNKKDLNILDSDSAFLKCASSIKGERIQLFQLNSLVPLKNAIEFQSRYTQQIIVKLDTKYLASLNGTVEFICRQNNYSDSTNGINIFHTKRPFIRVQGHGIQRFLIGQNIHFTIDLFSFPSAELTVFKIIKLENNNTYFIKQVENSKYKKNTKDINQTLATVQIMFLNVSSEDSGKYSIIATNFLGTHSYQFLLEKWENPSPILRVSIILGSLIAVTVTCLIFVIFYCKQSGYAIPIIQIQNNIYKSLENDSLQLLNAIWPDPLERMRWTIKPSSCIQIKEKIGGGNYGVVYTGVYKIPDSASEELVALKYPILSKPVNDEKPHGPSQFCQISLDCFINEIRILSQLTNCQNVIKMYGCTIFHDWINEKDNTTEPTSMLVLEFCSNFSLSEFLNNNFSSFAPYTRCRKFTLPNGYTGMKMDEGITLLDLKRITLGIATGLEYLSGLNIIHRDLASRNILLDEKKNPKICDFGLAIELDNDNSVSKSYQILTYNKALPYKILAPEALEFKIFYLESDIWSFSLLIWEIFNLERETLFPNIDSPGELLRYINSKLIIGNSSDLLLIPRYADESIWDLIKMCWCLKPFDRPSAQIIRAKLVDIVRESPVEVIRVSGCCTSDIYDSTYRDSLGSCNFPSTNTSIVTLNCSAICANNNSHNCVENLNDDFCHNNFVDESLL